MIRDNKSCIAVLGKIAFDPLLNVDKFFVGKINSLKVVFVV